MSSVELSVIESVFNISSFRSCLDRKLAVLCLSPFKMEQLGAMYEGEWTCLSKMYTTTEESDFMAQLLGGLNSVSYDHQTPENHPRLWLGNQPRQATTKNTTRNFVYDGCLVVDCVDPPEESISSSLMTQETSFFFVGSGQESCYHQEEQDAHQPLGTDDMISKMCFDDMMRPDDECLNKLAVRESEENNADAKCCASLSLSVVPDDHQRPEVRALDTDKQDKDATSHPISKKRLRNAGNVLKGNKRNVKPRKGRKAESSCEVDDEGTWGQNHFQTSSLTCSENDINASQDQGESSSSQGHKIPPALNLNGKTRAGRGSATDPQSLYARKRRERINDRLKTLQSLVPNGTKVDISTMLEEAVNYVKFLQLQIKLLSSDDLWMYAPLAYNGMDIGLIDINNTPR